VSKASPASLPKSIDRDPIGQFIDRTLHLNPFLFGVLIFILNIVVDGLLAWRFNAFFSSSQNPGLLQDPIALTTDLIVEPILCGLFLWTIQGTESMLRTLSDSDALKTNPKYREQLKHYLPLYRNRAIFVLALVLALFFTFTQVAAYMGWVPWRTLSGYLYIFPPMSFARAPFWFISIYAVLYAIYNVAVTIFVLHRIFQTGKIDLVPLHPDRCAGLGSIGDYMVRIGYVLAPLGFIISIWVIIENSKNTLLGEYVFLLAIVAYVVLAPSLFFLPLWTVHRAMRKSKRNELLKLADLFNQNYFKSVDDLSKPNKASDENANKKIEDVTRLYAVIEKTPEWPFDFATVGRYIAIVFGPLIPAVISVIVTEASKRIPFP